MALLAQKNVGGTTVVPASATVRDSFQTSSSSYSQELSTIGLPRIQFSLRYSGGTSIPPGGPSVPFPTDSATVQFQVAVRTVNGEPAFEVFDYILVPPMSTVQYEYQQPCIAIRLFMGVPLNGQDVKITYILSAFGP
jgi:hypothetical protein